MKEQYIKQVEKELSLPRKMKKEVVRDLNEVFASAMEHGETEQQDLQNRHWIWSWGYGYGSQLYDGFVF